MTNPLLYDFRRTLTSKSVLITIGVLILISFVFLLSISQAQNSGFGVSNNPSPSLVGYYDNNGYHFIMYASNQFGQGVSGYTAKLNISSPTGQLYTGGGTTNSSGYTTFSIAAPQNANVTISYTIILPGGTGTESSAGIIPFMQFNKNGTESAVPAGDTVVVAGQGLIGTITDSTNSSRSDIRVFYVAPFGQVPINYAIYYKLINSTGTGFVNFGAQYNESQMQLLGTLSGYVSTFSPPAVPSGYSQGSYFEFELFYSNATQITSQVIFVSQLYAPSAPPIQVTSLVSLFFAGIFGFFIPLVAIIGTYN
ncbi:MAG: hypothetical protein ACREBQ_14205, partial [Nitrososphaerales archaeon]